MDEDLLTNEALCIAFYASEALAIAYAWHESKIWSQHDAQRTRFLKEITRRNLRVEEYLSYEHLRNLNKKVNGQ